MYFIYLLECVNGSYYTGYTTDMERRYQEHLNGSIKCKYTRSFRPLRIAACWSVEADLSQVLKIEAAIKHLPKAKKHLLVQDQDIESNFSRLCSKHMGSVSTRVR